MSADLKIDGYKADHFQQYPDGMSKLYSNFTPRKSRIPGIDMIIAFSFQFVILKFLIKDWNETFFSQPIDEVLKRYKRRMDHYLGKDVVSTGHIAALHALGYLPLQIKAIPEGTRVPIRVPMFTITNTKPEQAWLVNYLESALSNKIWKGCTSATLAFQFRKTFEAYYLQTVGSKMKDSFVMSQGHDFSYRGMSGDDDACTSGAGHLLSFYGTDTVPAIDFLEEYYGANCEKETIGTSIPATEHSVMCMGTKEGEKETILRLITKVHPKGPMAIVEDTWDHWHVITETTPEIKTEILARDGTLVYRPDSGDPYRIIVGWFDNEIIPYKDGTFKVIVDPEYGKILTEAEVKGSIQCLWDTFGGTTTARGYRQLDSHIGLIYGDAINLTNQTQILEGLARKGFASTNVVLGIGSYTYQFQTRDTFGFAMKATYGEITENGVTEAREIFKNPKTDDGTKISAKGLIKVFYDDNGNLTYKDQCTKEEEEESLLETVFLDGKLTKFQTLAQIRETVNQYL